MDENCAAPLPAAPRARQASQLWYHRSPNFGRTAYKLSSPPFLRCFFLSFFLSRLRRLLLRLLDLLCIIQKFKLHPPRHGYLIPMANHPEGKASTGLNDLPDDVLWLILQHLDSLSGLHSLIRASRRCFHVFRWNPEFMLKAVLKRCITLEALPIAVAIIRAPTITQTTGVDDIRNYLDLVFNPKNTSFDMPTTRSDLVNLLRLYNRVSRFIDDYQTKALQLFQDSFPTIVTAPLIDSLLQHQMQIHLHRYIPSAPSHYPQSSELVFNERFFDMSSTARSSRGWKTGGKTDFRQGFKLLSFFFNLEEWEVEEMACVHFYYREIVRDVFQDVDRYFLKFVFQSPGLEPTPASSLDDIYSPTLRERSQRFHESDHPGVENLINVRSIKAEGVTGVVQKRPMVRFKGLRSRGIHLFAPDSDEYWNPILNCFVYLGVEFLRRLWNADVEERKDVLRAHYPRMRGFFQEGCDQLNKFYPGLPDWEGDNIKHPNYGYRVTRRRPCLWPGSPDRTRRRRGYVSWDLRRFAVPGVANALVQAKGKRGFGNHSGYFGRYVNRIPMEAQLSRYWLPQEQMDKLVEQFGSTKLTAEAYKRL